MAACVVSQAAGAADPAAFVRAYPESIAAFDGHDLVFRDGTRMAAFDGREAKTEAEAIRSPSIADMLRWPYEPGPLESEPRDDAGRVRNQALMSKLYGDCRSGEVSPRLVSVPWLPHTLGMSVRVTEAQGVARHLVAVSNELDALPSTLARFLHPLGGTYNCRPVADTGAPSMHGTGAAIDINVSYADYWLWRRGAPYRNRIPQDIVDVFERHGFIWGGKWVHYDTMHFEYRPELLGFDPGRD